jgi:hypothetical protein
MLTALAAKRQPTVGAPMRLSWQPQLRQRCRVPQAAGVPPTRAGGASIVAGVG